MKICGTVRPPLARWTISAFFVGSRITSISVNTAPLVGRRRLAALQNPQIGVV